MADLSPLLAPLTLRGLTLKNRIYSAPHSERYALQGKVTERMIAYHEEKVRGGAALTIFGGATSVAIDSPTTGANALAIWSDDVLLSLAGFARRIKAHGAGIMCQLSHMGRRMAPDGGSWLPILSSSGVRETMSRSFPKEMEDWDIRRVIRSYGFAARMCADAGLDGIELTAAAHHLIDQFWSPSVNRRTDAYGGSLENRARFGLEVLEEVRRQVGEDFVVGLRISGDEMLGSGLTAEDCQQIASLYASSGLVDFFDMIAGQSNTAISQARTMPNMTFGEAPYADLAQGIRLASGRPVFHGSRVTDIRVAARLVADGKADMIGMTRAHFADPYLVSKAIEGRFDDIRPCIGANECVSRPAGVICIHNAATGRELTLSHEPRRALRRQKVVVVGGGPSGLEAARIASGRGHEVILFEKEERLGGEVYWAAKAPGRGALFGLISWRGQQLQKQKVEIRLNSCADASAIREIEPDVVIVATGGSPIESDFVARTSYLDIDEVVRRPVPAGAEILLYDGTSATGTLATAQYLAEGGAQVEVVTPDRMIGADVNLSNYPFMLQSLENHSARLTTEMELISATRSGNKIRVELRSFNTRKIYERIVDELVLDLGRTPRTGLYNELKPASSNLGEVDLNALLHGGRQTIDTNPDGTFQLFRIGDAISYRGITLGIADAARLCEAL